MENADLFLENTLLLLAILLFLAILPRALRHLVLQKENTALDRAIEQFEKEELKAATEGESNENNRQDKSISPKDRSLAYTMEDIPTSKETQEDQLIPAQEEENQKKVKIVKEGVPISHNALEEALPASKKKVKLIKQKISISPGENKVPSNKAPSEPLKSKTPAQDQKTKRDGDSQGPPISDHENEESDGNWVEAEIPGLIIDTPPAAERSENIPTFKASPKAKHSSGAEKPQKSPQKGKQSPKVKNPALKSEDKKDPKPKKQISIKMNSPAKVKNLASKSEKIRNSKPKKQVPVKTNSPELKIEISESKPKVVEIKVPIVSHKGIAEKGAGQKKVKASSTKAGKTQKTELELAEVPPQREDIKTPREKVKPKPFLLGLKYLDQEELETVDPIVYEKLPADIMDVVIARLNALQVDLVNHLGSIPGELTPSENPTNRNIRKDRVQDSLPDLEGTVNEPSDKKEVSLEGLDSFLFTANQRKNRE